MRTLRQKRNIRGREIALWLVALCLVASLSFAVTSGAAGERFGAVRANLAAAASSPTSSFLDHIYRFFCPFGGCEEPTAESMGTNAPATAAAEPQPKPAQPAYAPAISAPSEPVGQQPTNPQPSAVQPINQTVVDQPARTEPVIRVVERVVETQRVVTEGGVSEMTLADRLNQLENKLRSLIFSQSSQQSAQTSAVSHAVALSQRIDNLSNTTITNPTITGGSITGTSIAGTITNAIQSALATIDDLTSNTVSATNVSFTNATTTTFYAGALSAGTASIANATTTHLATTDLRISSLDCTGYANSGTLTTDANGNVVCATDDGGAGSTVAGSDSQVQFNSGGGFAAAASFTFASSSGKLAVPYASTTALTASGTGYFNALSAGALVLANALPIASGGTGTSTAPSYGKVLVGNALGGYDLLATSSLGITGGGGGTWGSITGTLSNQTDLQNALDAKLSLASWYATTTDGLAQGSTNRYYADSLVQTYLGSIGKGFFFSTTSAVYWDSAQWRWATSSSDYWLSQYGKGFFFSTTSASAWDAAQWRWATSSANYFESTQTRWATTSSSYFLLQNQALAFSTTSANAWEAQFSRWSTSSTDYWKTANNFFSTSSAAYWDSLQFRWATTSSAYWESTQFRWATTSSDYWMTERNFFSTTSAAYHLSQNQGAAFSTTSASYFLTQNTGAVFSTTSTNYLLNSSTTIPRTTLANLWTPLQTFAGGSISQASSTFTGFTFLNGGASTTDFTATGNTVLGNATTTSLFATTASTTNFFGAGLALCEGGNVLTWAGGRFGCAVDQSGVGGSAWPFTPSVNYGVAVQSTSTPLWTTAGLMASTTSYFDGIGMATNAYLNFGGATSSAGYGFRDNAGVMEFKNLSGTWQSVTTATSGPSFSVYRSGNQSYTPPNDTKVQFNAETFDTNNNFDSGTYYRFTPTVPGKYILSGRVNFDVVNDAYWSYAAIYKNGVLYAQGSPKSVGSTVGNGADVTTIVDANGSTDYFELYGYAAAGATVFSGGSTGTYFTGALIAPITATGGGWQNDGTQSYLIDSTDNVGIGTSTPWGKLAIQGIAGQTNPLFQIASSTASPYLTLAASGNLGLGSSSPSTLLVVTGTSTLRDIIPEGAYTNNLSLYNIGDTTRRWNSIWAGTLNIGTSTFSLKSDAASSLGFFTGASGGGTQALTITSDGKLGIGTTTPAASLTIQAAVNTLPLKVASSSGATLLAVNTDGSLDAKLKQLTADYVVDSGSASISAGDIVSYVNGQVKKATIGANVGVPVAANAVASTYTSAATLDSTHFVVAYVGASNYANAVVGTISGTTITYGTPVALNSVSSSYISAATLDSTHFVVAYKGTSNYANAVVSSVSGTTITPGTPAALNAVASTYTSAAALDSTHFVVAYVGASNYVNAVVSSVSGTTITPGTPAVLNNVGTISISAAALDSTHFVVAYSGASSYATAVVSSVSGTTITPGTPAALNSISSSLISAAALDSTHFVIAYSNAATNYASAVVGTISGTTITPGTPAALNNVVPNSISAAALDSTHFVIAYQNLSTSYANALVSSVSGTTITPGTPAALNAVASTYTSAAALDSTHFVVAYQSGATTYANAVAGIFGGSNALGMATNAASAGGTVTVASNGIVSGLSGLSAGAVYYAAQDGSATTTLTFQRIGFALSSTQMLLSSGSAAAPDQYFGDMIFANNFRITEGWEYPNSLIWKNQLGREIMRIDETGAFSLPGMLQPVTAAFFNALLATTSAEELIASTTPDSSAPWRGSFAAASDALKSALRSFGATVIRVFTEPIYAVVGIFEKVFAKEFLADTRICIGSTCITESQLAAVLAATDQTRESLPMPDLTTPPPVSTTRALPLSDTATSTDSSGSTPSNASGQAGSAQASSQPSQDATAGTAPQAAATSSLPMIPPGTEPIVDDSPPLAPEEKPEPTFVP